MNYVPRFGMSAGTRLVLSVLAVLARDGIHAEVSLNNLAQLCGVHRNTVYRALLPDKDGTLAPLSMPRRPAGTAPTEDVRPLVGVDTPPNHSPLEPAVWNLAGLYDHAPMDLKESCG
ncbi:hypothetical protein [Brachybacterium sp. AOP35-5H-19]|uniref:hypothetical protein n=1 Tax=Brachybacterium sp. AOP35-5H-19 TaxID=3457685 RepID=UPI004034DFA6